MRTNGGRLANGAIIGLMSAVLLRGVLGCGAGETEGSGAAPAPTDEPAAETAEAPEIVIPDGIIDLENTVCPVMGNPVREGIYLDWEGYRIHFCCAGCDQTFLSDPERFLQILAEEPDVAEKLGMEELGEQPQ